MLLLQTIADQLQTALGDLDRQGIQQYAGQLQNVWRVLNKRIQVRFFRILLSVVEP